MTVTKQHIKDRAWVKESLINEIYGPKNYDVLREYQNFDEIELCNGFEFNGWDDYNKIHYDRKSKEEILKEEPPIEKFGVGILYPKIVESSTNESDELEENYGSSENKEDDSKELLNQKKQSGELKKLLQRVSNSKTGNAIDTDADIDEISEDAVSLSRIYKPRSIGITYCIPRNSGKLLVTMKCSRYLRYETAVVVGDEKKPKYVWLRRPIVQTCTIDVNLGVWKKPIEVACEGLDTIKCELETRIRADQNSEDKFMVTTSLVNKENANKAELNSRVIFQTEFSVVIKDKSHFQDLTNNSKMLDTDLLYHKQKNYAIGHGCAGSWKEDKNDNISEVFTDAVPFYEVPKISPDLHYPDWHPKAGNTFELTMYDLYKGNSVGFETIEVLIELYSSWLDLKKKDAAKLDPKMHHAAKENIVKIDACLRRIKTGYSLIKENHTVHSSFKLMNASMILQQMASKGENDRNGEKVIFTDDPLETNEAKSKKWRPFQIAFILMNLECFVNRQSEFRDTAELIWFPTGGGKTEAYLGIASFALITERHKGEYGPGTSVIMRYTLRLLTAQQFQRASSLICALEYLRKKNESELGTEEFSIGIWVGQSVTPNNIKQSCDAFLAAEKKGAYEYKFLIQKCPWCSSEMGPVRKKIDGSTKKYDVVGFRTSGRGQTRKIVCYCTNNFCTFRDSLPLVLNDEEIYQKTPSLLIATVDKFAMLSWKPESRAIFGLDNDGERFKNAPSLIIQDELHLITGPLGSVFGLYEAVVDQLSTDFSCDPPVKAKLIAATATTRASDAQIKSIYARNNTVIFPPPCIDFYDSFFSSVAKDDNGQLIKDRMYLGVYGRAYSSALTTNNRVFSSLLTQLKYLPDDRKDPWYTLLCYYNSLKELGANQTLFCSDIPERLPALKSKWGLTQQRWLNNIIELTGRLSNSELPKLLGELEKRFGADKYPVDVCLASNIIEVGVDVPRLSLMTIAGQPSGTAKYIQASGRIGRQLPGLIVVNYDTKKSRDASHYENFHSYHQKIYSFVEPSSTTPFTLPVLERCLAGVLLAYLRCKTSKKGLKSIEEIKDPSGELRENVESFHTFMVERIKYLYNDVKRSDEIIETFDKELVKILKKWEEGVELKKISTWGEMRSIYDEKKDSNPPLLRSLGTYCIEKWRTYSLVIPTSMRGVDPTCDAVIDFLPEVEDEVTDLSGSDSSGHGFF